MASSKFPADAKISPLRLQASAYIDDVGYNSIDFVNSLFADV